MTNRQILNHIRALAHEECTNCHAGCCALTDERCHIISLNDPSAQDGAIDCDYFLENVLPAGWDVQDLVAYALWYGTDDSGDPSNGIVKSGLLIGNPILINWENKRISRV